MIDNNYYKLYDETEVYTGFRTLWKPEASQACSARASVQVSKVIWIPYTPKVSLYKVFILYYYCIKPAVATEWLTTITTKDAPQLKWCCTSMESTSTQLIPSSLNALLLMTGLPGSLLGSETEAGPPHPWTSNSVSHSTKKRKVLHWVRWHQSL